MTIGQILNELKPKDWTISRLGSALKIKKELVGEQWRNHKLLSLTLRGVIPRDLENRMGKMPADFTTYQAVEKDDLIFCLFDVEETPRTVGWVPEAGMLTGAYTATEVNRGFDSRFIAYFYLSFDQYKSYGAYYSGLRNTIRKIDFSNIPLIYPRLKIQQAIADFLDHETAEIDAFIADQERLIELLNERRTATITHAVTKGLDPAVPMRDSGIPWLGEIPAHWESTRLSHVAEVKLGKMIPRQGEGEGEGFHPYLRAASIQPFGLDLSVTKNMGATAEEVKTLNLVADDVVVVEGGAGVGRSVKLQEDLTGFVFQNSINRVRLGRSLLPGFCDYFLKMMLHEGFIDLITNKATIPHLTAEKLLGIAVSVPPVQEQQEIIDSLDSVAKELVATVSEAERAITLSKERRSALISAAVTGQIDVSTAA